jgi:hypothetical protein
VLSSSRTAAAAAAPATNELDTPWLIEEQVKPPKRNWYGWQTLIADAAAAGILAGGLASSGQTESALLWTSAVTYASAGPLVHVAHGDSRGAGISLGVRVGAPLGGMVVGLGVGLLIGGVFGATQPQADCGPGPALCPPPAVELGLLGGVLGAVIGMSAGLIAAPIVDAALLTYEDEAPTKARARVDATDVRVAPAVNAPRDASGRFAPSVGLVGSF